MTTFSATTTQVDESITKISIGGYLDAHTAPELEQCIRDVVRKGHVRIVIDFSELDYISSAGLGVLMVFIEDVRKSGGDIKLSGMVEKVFSVFDLLGFPVLFNIYPTATEAIEAFPVA